MTYTPDLRDRVPQGSGAHTVNTLVEAGLPNIIGSILEYNGLALAGHTGAFYKTQNVNLAWETYPYNDRSYRRYFLFDAEEGRKYWHNQLYGITPNNIIYGNSSTVQPPALIVNFYIKAK